ncbi:MAG: iron-containing alcohol dehydrogenase, partial [Fibrobacterota bacterium]
MTKAPTDFSTLLSSSRTRVEFGPGSIRQLGTLAKAHGAKCVLLVTDRGIVAAGHAERAADSLRAAGLTLAMF